MGSFEAHLYELKHSKHDEGSDSDIKCSDELDSEFRSMLTHLL